jgi:hypothetical protein
MSGYEFMTALFSTMQTQHGVKFENGCDKMVRNLTVRGRSNSSPEQVSSSAVCELVVRV